MGEATIRLDGREFAGISQSLTSNQDDYILAHLRLAGAIDVLTDGDGKERTNDERANELLTQILLSGRKHFILAGCLTEVGKKWSRADADLNAVKFAEISSFEEKTLMRTATVRFVVGFFLSGEPSSASSPKSSNHRGKVRRTASADPATSETSPQ
jgi:hypothetical protein